MYFCRNAVYIYTMRTIIPSTENKALLNVARDVPIAEIAGVSTRKLILEMKYLLAQEQHGVALAAPQVGESLRIFIVSGSALAQRDDDKKENPDAIPTESYEDQVYINPVLIKISRAKKEKHEGCLSIRGKWGMVPRAEKATIRAYDEHGVLFTSGASGFLAHIFQHEMDHLDGILYIDKAKKLYDDKPANEK
jgi:peptide deformylase